MIRPHRWWIIRGTIRLHSKLGYREEGGKISDQGNGLSPTVTLTHHPLNN
jgi:hypothetical protein